MTTIFTEATPIVQALAQRKLQNLLARMYAGEEVSPEEISRLIARNPALYKQVLAIQEGQNKQKAVEEFNRTIKGVTVPGSTRLGAVPSLTEAQQPFGAGLGLDVQGLLTGARPAQPAVTPEITETAPYTRQLTPDEIQQAILQRIGATGNFSELSGVKYLSEAATEDEKRRQLLEKFNLLKALIGETAGATTKPRIEQTGPFSAEVIPGQTVYPTPERYANIQARAGLLEGRPQDIMGGQLDLAKIDTEIADANNKVKEGVKIDEEIKKIQQDTIRIAADADRLKAAGRKAEAEAIEQEIINKYVPQIQELLIKSKQAETGYKQAQTQTEIAEAGRKKAETGKIQTAAGGEKAKPLTATLQNKLSDFTKGLEGDKRRAGDKRFWTKPRINTREQAESTARANGLDPEHPQVKAVIDYYFPESTITPGKIGKTTKVFEY